MRPRLLIACLIVPLAVAVTDAQRPADAPGDLPVRRVILYKNGVGYFEHIGQVTGDADVSVRFTTGQLNDALKSLTTLDLDGGTVSSVRYNSIAPVDQRLSALHLPLGAAADPLQFYQALRGTRIDVRTAGTTVSGRLLTVERRARTRGEVTEEADQLTLVSDDGSIRTFELGPGVVVQLADRDLRGDLASYLAILGSERSNDARQMVIATRGVGTRRLFVSYISEVPVWKSTYRVIMPSDGKPVLHGWAIVDNTVGQDWSNVDLSLVAGAPQSFVQEVGQPLYTRRPVVPVAAAMLPTPQTHAPTLVAGKGAVEGSVHDTSGAALPGVRAQLLSTDGVAAASAVSNADGEFRLEAPPGNYTLRAELSGFSPANLAILIPAGGVVRPDLTLAVGSVTESVRVTAESPVAAAPPAPPPAPLGMGGGFGGGVRGGLADAPLRDRRAADQILERGADAMGRELGDLFEFHVKQPVTIRKNESALVPIVAAPIEAERVSVWNRGNGSGRPLRSLWLTNSTGLTLDGGSISVIDANAFAGEGLIDPVKPGEKRLVSYGTDLGVLVSVTPDERPRRFTRLVANQGLLVASLERRAAWTYQARNEDTSARTLVIEHILRPGWSLDEPPAPTEKTAGAARYTVPVASKQEATLVVHERRVDETRYTLTSINEATVVALVTSGAPEGSVRTALRPLIEKQAEIAAADARVSAIDARIASIGTDQARVRENMKALRGSSEEKALLQRYTRELNDQEDELTRLKTDRTQAAADRDVKRRELSELAGKLSFNIAVGAADESR